MAEYIEREAALADLELYETQVVKNEYALAIAGCRSHIRKLPAADVRPVVLCRDCEYYFKDEDGYEMCENSEGYDHVTGNGFCAWGEKREES